MQRIVRLMILVACGLAAGCVTSGPSPITPGNARRFIEPGKTHLAEIVQVFGPPNIVTRRDGTEMWIYDKVSSRQTASVFGIGGGGGLGSGGAGGGLIGGGLSSSTRSETTVMLIVYYDENDIVKDYKITQTKF